jgi:hypothetical protein
MKALLHSLTQIVASIEPAHDNEKLMRYATAHILFNQLKEEIESSTKDRKHHALGCLALSLDCLKWALFPVDGETKSSESNFQSALDQLESVRYDLT